MGGNNRKSKRNKVIRNYNESLDETDWHPDHAVDRPSQRGTQGRGSEVSNPQSPQSSLPSHISPAPNVLMGDSPPQWFTDAMENIEKQFTLFRNEMKDLDKRLMTLIESCKERLTVQENKTTELETKVAELHDQMAVKHEIIEDLKKKKDEHEKKLSEVIQQLRLNIENQDAAQRAIAKKEALITSNTLILSGNKVPSYKTNEGTAEIAIEVLKKNIDYDLDKAHISLATRMSKALPDGNEDKRGIKISVINKAIKDKIVNQNLGNFQAGLYINEELTESVNRLYYEVRNLKKKNRDKIDAVYTRDGIIRVRREKRV